MLMKKLMYKCCLFAMLIISCRLSSQNTVVDSLEALLKTTTIDTLRLALYTDLYWELRNNDDAKALEYAKQGLKEAAKFAITDHAPHYYFHWQAVMKGTYATALSAIGEYDKALEIANDALLINTKLN